MNKNLFIYSFKYLAVLLALVTFSSCERDEFTEQDAFDLQQAQLDAQAAREEAALASQDRRVMDMAMFRRSMDSLTRLNSGGKVFYTVNVVPGGSSAFASGRFEEIEGLDGATVTVSQLGGAVVEQKTTVAGLASFEMYSGEVTVNIEAPNHTDLNYTANLTPDGGVPNGALMYVGNVVPVFDDPNNPAAGSEENLATVKGFAFAELDITQSNNVEEAVPDGTKVRAFIDINDAFRAKYINQANDEGVNNGGQPTASGAIQRFAYEEAASTTGSTVTGPLTGNNPNDGTPEGGEYSITIGATAVGLPIQMKFDDFAENRIYYFNDSDGDVGNGGGTFSGPGSKRFIYTQNTQAGGTQNPTVIGRTGLRNFAPFSTLVEFDLAQTEATATASLSGGTSIKTVTGPAVVIAGVSYNQYLETGLDDDNNEVTNEVDGAYVGDGNRGSYISTPTVVFPMPTDAAGVQATGVAIMGLAGEAEAGLATNDDNGDNDLRPVVSILVTNPGSGYSDSPTTTTDDIIVSFDRYSYTGKDAAGVPIPNGYGTVQAPSSSITYVEIIDGGFAMTSPFSLSAPGAYTGNPPTVLFNNPGDAPGVTPAGGAAANAVAVVDETVGTVTEVQVTAGGNGYSNPIVTFNYGEGAQVILTAPTTAVFETNGTGGVRFSQNTNANALDLVGTEGNIQLTAGTRPYTFVPGVQVQEAVPTAGQIAPTVAATVNAAGQVISLNITNPGSGYAGAAGTAITNLTLQINPRNVGVSATAYTQGTGIDNYVIEEYGTPESSYKSKITDINGTFNYLTTNGAEIVAQDGTTVFNAADVQQANPSLYSDYIVYFAPSSTGSQAVGYPIFDNAGENLVGIKITTPGANYEGNDTEHSFWVVPNGVTLNEYASGATTTTNNSFVKSTLTAQTLTITFTDGGLGYAIRPEFIISGGNRSVEDLATLNTSLNGVRGSLRFNSAGSITNSFVRIALPAGTFTAAGIAAEPLSVIASVDRLQGIFNAEANFPTSDLDGAGDFDGGILTDSDNGVDYLAPEEWTFYEEFDFALGTDAAPFGPTTSVKDMFNKMEAAEFTNDERIGTNNTNYPVADGFKYITAPTYRVLFAGVETGGEGVTVLEPGTADIIGFDATANGSLPAGFGLTSFFVPTNNPNTTGAPVPGSTTGARLGERFRTIGGPSNFEVFSGLTYIRDVNYGTGIELE